MLYWNIDKDWLYQKYIVEQLSTRNIAVLVGCKGKTIDLRLHQYDIPVRTKEDAARLRRTGKEVPCLVCNKLIYRKNCRLLKFDKFFCSWDCAKEYQAVGSDNWRSTREYKDWRNSIIERDERCILCESSINLVAHHIIEAQDNQLLRLEKDNGVTLCEQCHINIHKQDSRNFIKPLQAVILDEKLRISVKV
jgi:hypothetical protein